MKQVLWFLFLLIPCTSIGKEYSKRDVLAHAFIHSEDLKVIKEEIEAAQSMKREYFGKGLPSIEASVNYQHTPQQYMPYSFSLAGTGETSIISMLDQTEPGFKNAATIAGALDQILSSLSSIDLTPKKNTIAAGLSLTQPLFAQGKITKGVKLATIYNLSLDLKYNHTRYALARDIVNAYNSAVLAEQNKEVRLQAVTLAEETHRVARARLESGKGNVLDTLNSKYSLQQAVIALREAQKNRRLAIKNMLTVASLDANADEIVLTDSLVVIPFTLTENEARERMIQQNTAIQQLDKGIEMQELQTKIAKSDYLPTVYAGGSVSKISMFESGEKFRWGNDQKLFIGTSIPIFSGGQKYYKVQQAIHEEQKLQETRKKTINQLTLALANCYEELAMAREEFEEALHLIALTTQGEQIASLSYEIGQITQVELTNSKQQLNMSRLAYNSAVFKLNTAIVGIKTLITDPSLLLNETEER